ncbi:MAG: hypothetical protein NDI69_16940 [Bacteriovoracaceae bacterium]|nr:hypothetical protein [Bacteriovoracaceae bacterium]
MKNTDQSKEQKPKHEGMNYNDRLDGYGFGEAESRDSDKEYEQDPHFTKHCIDMGEGYRAHRNEPYTKDEFGLRNLYGPVDQYVFRSYHLVTREERAATKDAPEEDEQKKD